MADARARGNDDAPPRGRLVSRRAPSTNWWAIKSGAVQRFGHSRPSFSWGIGLARARRPSAIQGLAIVAAAAATARTVVPCQTKGRGSASSKRTPSQESQTPSSGLAMSELCLPRKNPTGGVPPSPRKHRQHQQEGRRETGDGRRRLTTRRELISKRSLAVRHRAASKS
jgi:hypothetical protein